MTLGFLYGCFQRNSSGRNHPHFVIGKDFIIGLWCMSLLAFDMREHGIGKFKLVTFDDFERIIARCCIRHGWA